MLRSLGALISVLIIACSDAGIPSAVDDKSRRLGLTDLSNKEEEVFGSVWIDGNILTSSDPDYYVVLRPDLGRDPGYWSRNQDLEPNFSTVMLVDPEGQGQPWGWYVADDPIGNAGICVRGHANDIEQHQGVDPSGQLTPSGAPGGRGMPVERHCIRPGAFTVELQSPLGNVVASREIDFISGQLEDGVLVEDPTRPDKFIDNIVHFDIDGGWYFLYPGFSDPGDGFAEETLFRFNAGSSWTGWDLDQHRGRVSVRWTWDIRDQTVFSGYMNTEGDAPIVRVHRYNAGQIGTVTAEGTYVIPSTDRSPATKRRSFEVLGSPAVTSIVIDPGDSVRAMIHETIEFIATPMSAVGDTLLSKPVTWSEANQTIQLLKVTERR